MGIEPTTSAWKAEVIPLYDDRLINNENKYIYFFSIVNEILFY